MLIPDQHVLDYVDDYFHGLLSEPDAPTRAKMLLEQMSTLAALDRCQRRAGHGGDWALN